MWKTRVCSDDSTGKGQKVEQAYKDKELRCRTWKNDLFQLKWQEKD